MNKKYLISFLVLFISISDFCFSFDYCKYADRIVSSYSKELSKTKGLHLCGKGGAMMHDIQEISVHYTSLDKLTVYQARKLYIEIAEEYLRRINENEKIRPFLHKYPFKIDNLDLKIGFNDRNGNMLGDGYVAYVSRNNRGEIFYRKYENGKLNNIHREPYDEALKIVNKDASQETNPLDSSQNPDFYLHSNE